MAVEPKYIVSLGTDHAGYRHKEAVKAGLEADGHTVRDYGAYSDESSDYPDFVRPAAEAIVQGEADYAIVFGGSGNGEAIVANKVKGVRCGLCWDEWAVDMTRRHNNANAMALGSRVVSEEQAVAFARQFLATPFDGGRHERRVNKIEG